MIPRRQNRRYRGNNYDAADITRLTMEGEKVKHDLKVLRQELDNSEDEIIRSELQQRVRELEEDLQLKTERISKIRKKNKS